MALIQVEIFSPAPSAALNVLRQLLTQVMKERAIMPVWQEYSSGHSLLPIHFKNIKQLTLAINGTAFILPADAASWKGYIATAIDRSLAVSGKLVQADRRLNRLKLHCSFLLTVFIALFPKCPFCWAAYLSLLGLVSAGSVPYKPWFLPVAIMLLTINMVALYLSQRRNQVWPFWINMAGVVLVVGNRLSIQSTGLAIVAGGLMLIAACWNALPARMSLSVSLYIQKLLPIFQLKKTAQ